MRNLSLDEVSTISGGILFSNFYSEATFVSATTDALIGFAIGAVIGPYIGIGSIGVSAIKLSAVFGSFGLLAVGARVADDYVFPKNETLCLNSVNISA